MAALQSENEEFPGRGLPVCAKWRQQVISAQDLLLGLRAELDQLHSSSERTEQTDRLMLNRLYRDGQAKFRQLIDQVKARVQGSAPPSYSPENGAGNHSHQSRRDITETITALKQLEVQMRDRQAGTHNFAMQIKRDAQEIGQLLFILHLKLEEALIHYEASILRFRRVLDTALAVHIDFLASSHERRNTVLRRIKAGTERLRAMRLEMERMTLQDGGAGTTTYAMRLRMERLLVLSEAKAVEMDMLWLEVEQLDWLTPAVEAVRQMQSEVVMRATSMKRQYVAASQEWTREGWAWRTPLVECMAVVKEVALNDENKATEQAVEKLRRAGEMLWKPRDGKFYDAVEK